MSYPCSAAYRYPACIAPPMPRLKGMLITVAQLGTCAAVSSVDPSSTTRMSYCGSDRLSRATSFPTDRDSLKAGTIIRQRSDDGDRTAGIDVVILAAAWGNTNPQDP